MGKLSMQIALFISIFLGNITTSLIIPFYPRIAQEKGLSLWMVGLVLSMNPLARLIMSPIIGKYLYRIGRKNAIILSFATVGLSMLLFSPIEYTDSVWVAVLSLLGRFAGGLGSSCAMITIITVFLSDFPNEIQYMIAKMEVALGLGLSLGPVLGLLIYIINLLTAFVIAGGLILLFCPIAWYMLGTFRPYEIKNIKLNRLPLLIKPVIFIQRIYLPLSMQFSFIFSLAVLGELLGLHLYNFGMSFLYVSLAFIMHSFIYMIMALTIGKLLKGKDERIMMTIGILSICIGCVVIAPWDLIFPQNVGFVYAALPILAFGQALVYCKNYVVFSIPFMIKSATIQYGYPKDDILTDVISSFGVIAQALGQIAGFLYAGLFAEVIGIDNAFLGAAGFFLCVGVCFFLGTGAIGEVFCKRKEVATESVIRNHCLIKMGKVQ
jgi:MFS family permease